MLSITMVCTKDPESEIIPGLGGGYSKEKRVRKRLLLMR